MIITLLSDPRDSSVARRKGRICIHSTSPNPIIKFLKPSDKHRCNSMCKRNSGFSRYCPLRAFVAFVSTSTDPHPFSPDASCANDLLELLLGAELVGVTALLLALWRLLVHDVEMWQGCRSSCKNDGAVAGTYLRQIILSQLYLEARALREGSMIPPRRRRTKWRVDSFWML
jgi:hypothetical protein